MIDIKIMALTPETLRAITDAQQEFVWEMPAFEERDRGPWWYVIVSVIALISVAYGVWVSNYLFALIIIISAIILLLTTEKEPHSVLVQIGDHGVVVDGEFVSFEKLANFSVIYHPPATKVLYIERKYSIKPRLKLYLGEEDPVALREHLLRYLPEDLDLRDEHLSDILGRLLKI